MGALADLRRMIDERRAAERARTRPLWAWRWGPAAADDPLPGIINDHPDPARLAALVARYEGDYGDLGHDGSINVDQKVPGEERSTRLEIR